METPETKKCEAEIENSDTAEAAVDRDPNRETTCPDISEEANDEETTKDLQSKTQVPKANRSRYREVTSLALLPQFADFVDMFEKFTEHEGREMCPYILDDCIIDMEILGVSNAKEMLDLMEETADGSQTLSDWVSVFAGRFWLVERGAVESIDTILAVLMHSARNKPAPGIPKQQKQCIRPPQVTS